MRQRKLPDTVKDDGNHNRDSRDRGIDAQVGFPQRVAHKRHEQDGGEFHEMGGIHMAVGRTDKLTVWIERRRQQVAGCRPNIREINMLERSDSSKPVIRCKKTLLPLTRNK
jgi:hypothetical protein